MPKIKLYRHALSGHSHRVEMFLSILGLDVRVIDVDLQNGVHKKSEFLKMNPAGQVPVLVDGDTILSDSNAILAYLAIKYDPTNTWFPNDAETVARIQRFLSIAAGQVAYGPAAARLVTVFGADINAERAIETAHTLLQILEDHLEDRQWLVSDSPTIADVANYAYIAHAPEGNVSLEEYPNVRAWLVRTVSLKGFVGMQNTQVGLAA